MIHPVEIAKDLYHRKDITMSTRRTRLARMVVYAVIAALAGCQSGGSGRGGAGGEPPRTPDQDEWTEGETVTLSAPEVESTGGVPTYLWTQIEGPPVELDDPTARTPTFPAPQVEEATVLGFKVEVTSAGTTLTFDVEVVVHPATDEGEPEANGGGGGGGG